MSNACLNFDEIIESMSSSRKSGRLPVCGVGIFDADFPKGAVIDGKWVVHRAYTTWCMMIKRCHEQRTEVSKRAYGGCAVSNEWLNFSNFFSFWKSSKYHIDGCNLDKDLLLYGNKQYSRDRCLLIPQALNRFTTSRSADRGDYPQGVHFSVRAGKFASQISHGGEKIHLGYFDSPANAHRAWHKKKIELAWEWKDICDSIHPRLFAGLMTKVRCMREC